MLKVDISKTISTMLGEERTPVQWIMSEGGPLICVEASLAALWKGVVGLSVPSGNAATDYDRACDAGLFAGGLPLQKGMALVIGSGPQDTSIWTSSNKVSYIVVVECAEPDVDEPALLASMDDSIFDRPLSVTEVTFASADIIMFDSAERGDERDKKVVAFNIEPGRYRVLSQMFQPNRDASFIVHKLELLS